MQLSPHFTLAELTKTGTGLTNNPSPAIIDKLKALCVHVLEPVREHYGKPVTVNSGYRSPAVNAAVGSKSTSQHAKGEAADIEVAGVANAALARWIRDNLDFDQLIAEAVKPNDPAAGWVHVSWVPVGRRKQCLTATMGSHGMVYSKGLP